MTKSENLGENFENPQQQPEFQEQRKKPKCITKFQLLTRRFEREMTGKLLWMFSVRAV